MVALEYVDQIEVTILMRMMKYSKDSVPGWGLNDGA